MLAKWLLVAQVAGKMLLLWSPALLAWGVVCVLIKKQEAERCTARPRKEK